MQIQKTDRPVFDAKHLRVGIVTARFNSEITHELEKNACETLRQSGVENDNITILSVAGCVEVPYALLKLAETKHYDCLVAIGCVIRGETPHFEYVCKMAQEGVLKVSLDKSIPIGFGVLTLNTLDQARERFHVGGDAALGALEGALLSV